MSQVKISGDASGTGILTIAAPNTNSNFTLTLPAATGTFNTSGVVNEVPAGTAALPAITTTGDTNTGIFFPAADTIAFTEGGAEAMRIDSAGNVGIGASPAATNRLQVSSTGSTRLLVENTTNTVALRMQTATASALIQTDTNHPLTFATNNGAEAMRIDTSGNLLVGTTSATGSSRFVVAADTTSTNVMSVVNTRSTASTDYSILFYRAGNIVGSVQTTLSATSFVTSSDYRLKEDIQPMTGALAKVAQLNPVTYKWKLDSTEAQGFIAHELQAVVPDCVTGLKDELDAEGNPKYQGIDTSFLVATLTAAIKEQQALITALTARITALEAI